MLKYSVRNFRYFALFRNDSDVNVMGSKTEANFQTVHLCKFYRKKCKKCFNEFFMEDLGPNINRLLAGRHSLRALRVGVR